MQASAGPERRRAREGRLAILLAAVAWSTAGLGQRSLDATAVTQVAGRAFFAALALFALVLAMERRGTLRAFLGMGRSGLAMTVFLAISSGAFLLALNHTSVANVLFMQAAAPMMAALLGWVLISEPVDGRTWAALLLAGAGVAVMAAGSLDAGIAAVGLPLLMTASFAVVIVIARHRRDVSMMPATCASQVLVVVVCAPFARASMSNKGRADNWHRRAVIAEEAVGGLRVVIAERSRALNERTLQANQLASRLDSRGMALQKTKVSVGTLTRRQRALTAENAAVRAERNKLRSQLATARALASRLSACSESLSAVVASAKGKKAATVTANARPLVESCRKARASYETYRGQAR